MLQAVLTAELSTVFLVFARIGAAFVILPSVGESFLSPRVRLLLALLLTLIIAPVVSPIIPDLPPRLGDMTVLLFKEIMIGLFIGTAARIFFAALAIAGSFYSFLSGLASIFVFNPLMAGQGSLLSVFFSLAGLLLIFATNTHHLLIRTVVDSYVIFKPGAPLMAGDMADVITKTLADSFRLGLQLSAPMVVVALLFYVLLGLLARLMPQLQVFFIAIPLQIMMGLFLLMTVFSGMMMWFLQNFQTFLGQFLPA